MTQLVDKVAVAAAFGRAAGTYERFANLQRTCGNYLLEGLATRGANSVLDAGCGTGWYSRLWRERGSDVVALDISREMLEQCQQTDSAHRFLEGDIESIPLADEQVDLAWSNLAVQWCSDLRQGLSELYRVTKPGGCIAFTTLAAGSLPELHQAWREVDKRPHANQFLSVAEIEQACSSWRAALTCRTVSQQFPDVMSAMRSLKGVGATHLHEGRKNTLMTRGQLARLSEAWPKQEGLFSLSWQIIFGVIERD
ncbi:Malonyl-CoA O-methyltransferase BioC [Cedecea lapagei]|uniref:Malonyl-[acyl-carrier protein] O-methyltransferase n=1 Tax=Cedecea lapagei TaxID=158823 RepID=A0A3S4MGX6_9ENTR|nr:malonyl-ACP O-methyltransferase BioC [Cedecea lapagei]VEB99482.1 Malonyl-CoA O-methyltransferase BioC [Cedecea lapagei]